MNKKQNKIEPKNLQVMYVFSKDNTVYLKNNTYIKALLNTAVKEDEWFPVNFHWKTQ